MKIKTKKQSYEFTDIREKTTKHIWGYYNGYYIEIEKAEKRYQTREKTVWSVTCQSPGGCYVYDGCFEGTMHEALIDVFENIELDEDEKMECPNCKTIMEMSDDLIDDEDGTFLENWICPKCGEIVELPIPD
jgi:phage FluMu protein Com